MSTMMFPTPFVETCRVTSGDNFNLGRPSPGKLDFPSTSPASHCCLIPVLGVLYYYTYYTYGVIYYILHLHMYVHTYVC